MNKAWISLLIVLLVLSVSVYAQITVDPINQVPPGTDPNSQSVISQQLSQRLVNVETRLQQLPSNSDIDVLLATQLKLQEAYWEDRVNYLTIVILFCCIFSVVGVACAYFLLKSKGRI